MRQVGQRREGLAMPDVDDRPHPDLLSQLIATIPAGAQAERIFVALVDDELCAYINFRTYAGRYRWDVLGLAAGSPRLDPTDDVSIELWTELLEYAVRQAGDDSVKRLFATATDDGAASESLVSAGFERYAQFMILAGTRPPGPIGLPEGMRAQHASDVWSIHQLYHHVTPRAVQFAEALTSTVWELPERPWLGRLSGMPPKTRAFVLDTKNGVQAYCGVRIGRSGAMARLLVEPEHRSDAVPLVMAAIAESGVAPGGRLRVLVPDYSSELAHGFHEAGFELECERTAFVRHTTAPAVVHARLAPITAESGERAPRSVPTYVRNARKSAPGCGAGGMCS